VSEVPGTAVRAPAFDISPQVVFRLGDELITDELQALVELVKNSYDASATTVSVHIDTSAHVPEAPPRQDDHGDSNDIDETADAASLVGWLEVRDDGDGMTRDQVDHGWLLISASDKREMKEQGRTNRLGRTPLGDKGLGRLGVLRLGTRVEIRTRPRSVPEEHILRFSRTDFEREIALSDIRLRYERRQIEEDPAVPGIWRTESDYDDDVDCTEIAGRQGTVLRITGLNNAEVWQDRVRVQQEMLSLISPFEEIDAFSLAVHLDDPDGKDPLPLGTLAELRRDLAETRWTFEFDGTEITATGRLKLKAFEPAGSNDRLTGFWTDHVAIDQGAEYRHRLIDGPLATQQVETPEPPWWLRVSLSVALTDVVVSRGRTRLRKGNEPPSAWADPGPFSGELDSFSLARDFDVGSGDGAPFDSTELYQRWVRDVRGVKVFRDGFGVRVGADFLGLGAGFTGGRSFFTLRPGNVVGYIALTARNNAQLQETTDREGFVVNPAYRTFSALLQTLVDRINVVQTQIGRELSSWADTTSTPTVEPPSRRAASLAREAALRDERTRATVGAVAKVQHTLQELADGGALLTPPQAAEARRAGALLQRLQELVGEGETLRRDLEELAAGSAEVEHERAQLRDQLRVAYQTVGLGIVAETVAHEMTNIVGRLQARVDALTPQFKGPEHRAVRALITEVRTTIRAIRLQLRHLEPQLRYQRTRRQSVDVLAAVEGIAAYHRDRLAPSGMTVDVTGSAFMAHVNQGRIQQAVDNLLINSEFWLEHARTSDPRIEIVVAQPLVTVRDNGPGVDPSLETAIFEPFVSGRSGEQGRGLGLFIARQVLGDDDVTIHLGRREDDGRRRSFVLDFSAATRELVNE
jgi:signal transduction histidine kinase